MNSQNNGISVLIPAYNEESAIGEVIKHLKKVLSRLPNKSEIVIIDDGSSDHTSVIAKDSGARVIQHLQNRGYGSALKTGIKAAKYDIIVITDADGTYPAESIPELVDKMRKADMVIGARTGQNVNIPIIRQLPKWLLRKLAGYITGEHIPDLNSGLRVFRRQCAMQYLKILSDKFSFTTTITVAMLCDYYRVIFVPIDYHKRVGKSKIVPWDFINFVTIVLRLSMLFNPLKIFIPVALSFLFLGGVKFIFDFLFMIERAGGMSWEILKTHTISASTLLLFLSGLQILLVGMISDGIIRKIAQNNPNEYQMKPEEITHASN